MRSRCTRVIFPLVLMICVMSSLVLPTVTAADGLASTPWPMFRHDEQHTGRTPYSGPISPAIVWRYGTGDWVYSSPAIGQDGTIYVGSLDNYFYAINPDGSLKWRFRTQNKVYSSPAIGADGTVYFGSNDQWVYALSSDGKMKWKFATGDRVRSSPVIGHDGTIYVGSADNYLYALDANGTLKWSQQTPNNIFSSPAIGPDGTIYIGEDSQYLYAINPNGSVRWRYGTMLGIDSPPAVGADGTIYVGSDWGDLHAVNPNGTVKWTYMTDGSIPSSPAIGLDGTIYFGSTDNNFYALGPDGKLKWQYTTADQIHSSPTIGADGTVYVGSLDGYLYAFTPDGERLWRFKAGPIYSSPIIGPNRMIYFGSNDNHLYALGEGYKPESPIAAFNFSPDDVRTGIIVTFDATNSHDPDGDIESYQWNFGDGGVGTGRFISHTYSNPGGYNVMLTVVDDDGYSATKERAITVSASTSPVISLEFWPEEPLVGDKVAFDAAASQDPDGTIINYDWNFGDGTMATGEVVTHTYNSPGAYSVTLTLTDNDGLSSSRVLPINIGATTSPVASVEIMPQKPAPGARVAFDASDSSDSDGEISTYEWDFGDGSTGTGELVTHIYNAAGEYQVTLTLTDDTGNVTSYSRTLTVGAPVVEDDSSDDTDIPIWMWLAIGAGAVLFIIIVFYVGKLLGKMSSPPKKEKVKEKAPERKPREKAEVTRKPEKSRKTEKIEEPEEEEEVAEEPEEPEEEE